MRDLFELKLFLDMLCKLGWRDSLNVIITYCAKATEHDGQGTQMQVSRTLQVPPQPPDREGMPGAFLGVEHQIQGVNWASVGVQGSSSRHENSGMGA